MPPTNVIPSPVLSPSALLRAGSVIGRGEEFPKRALESRALIRDPFPPLQRTWPWRAGSHRRYNLSVSALVRALSLQKGQMANLHVISELKKTAATKIVLLVLDGLGGLPR